MIRNNQNGRRRGRGGARPPQQGGGPSGNYGNNNGGGSRIDTRQRGNATQLLEKYKAMARDATQNGDRVQAEFYMQYADHYFRVLNEFRARDPQPAQRPTYDDDDDGYGASTVGQNYAAASERYDDDGDEPSATAPSNGSGERPAYRAAERPRGNDNYAQGERTNGRDQRADRDDRDPQRSRGFSQREASDDGREAPRITAPRNDNLRNDNPRDDDARNDPGQRAEMSGERRERDAGRGDGQRRDTSRDGRGAGRDASREVARYDNSSRDAAPDRAAPREEPVRLEPRGTTARAEPEPLIGLPGPATLATTATASVSEEPVAAIGSAEAPVPRKRGRPRKIVVADSVDG